VDIRWRTVPAKLAVIADAELPGSWPMQGTRQRPLESFTALREAGCQSLRLPSMWNHTTNRVAPSISTKAPRN
jgi:hypothetical protein